MIDPNQEFDEITEELWQYVYWRDNGLCQAKNCGKVGSHAHHIKYRSEGGKNCASNLILLCDQCHGGEHDSKAGDKDYYLKRVCQNEEKYRKNMA